MGFAGKHVLKSFGDFKDLKVRYVLPYFLLGHLFMVDVLGSLVSCILERR